MTNERRAAVKAIRKANRAAAAEKFIIVQHLAAFAGGRVESLATCSVDGNGTVRVFDDKMNGMTSCHSISEHDQARIREAVAAGKSML